MGQLFSRSSSREPGPGEANEASNDASAAVAVDLALPPSTARVLDPIGQHYDIIPDSESCMIGVNKHTGENCRAFTIVARHQSVSPRKPAVSEALVAIVHRLQTFSHTSIAVLRDAFFEEKKIYLCQEQTHGPTLQQKLNKYKYLDEKEARSITKQLLQVVAYLHEHHQLLVQNLTINSVLFVDSETTEIKVGQIGFDQLDAVLEANCLISGSTYVLFTPPEVLFCENFQLASCVWAVACLLYTILVGKTPFEAADDTKSFENIMTVSFALDGPQYDHISPAAKHFIRCCLQRDPKDRPTPAECLTHAWFEE